MSEQIDWSKAPEGTIGLGHVGAGHFYAWFSDRWYEYVDSNHGGRHYFGDTCAYSEKDIVSCPPRPATTSWSGEGLPPVGVVCEYRCVNDQWRQVKVIAHMIEMQKDNPCAVSQLGDTGPLCIGGASSFRPIRTPEQIAADEREAAIKEMTAGYSKDSGTLAGWAAYVYDTLGYRKP